MSKRSDELKVESGKWTVNRLILACFYLLLGFSIHIGEAQGELAPFLYYYSDTLRTFVIERADGTDSRVLSQVAMPEETNDVQIRGWSPSGEWLAWTSSTASGEITHHHAWAANIDGERSLEALAVVGNVDDMLWSPTEDLLFVSDWDQTTANFFYDAVYTHRFFLIDAQTDATLTSFEMEISFADIEPVVWTQDGEYVTFAYSVETESSSESFVRRISRTGEVEDISIPDLPEITIHLTSNPALNNLVITRSEDRNQLIVANIVSGEIIGFDTPAPIERIFLYQWNYTGEQALIYIRTPDSGDRFELWLLSMPDQTLQSIATNVGNYTNERGTWFPWSFYGNQAIFYTDEGLFALELESELEISQITASQVSLMSPQWYRDGRLYFTARVEDADGTPQLEAYVYDFLTDTLSEQDSRFSPYRISGDGQFTVVVNPLSLVYREGSVVPIQSHRQVAHGPEYFLEWVYWYRDEPWFMITETNMGVNRGLPSYRRYTSVNNVDGTVHRELNNCYSSCAAWLPQQVLAHVESE